MNYNLLKKIRVFIAFFFLLLTGFLFIDVRHLLPKSFIEPLLFLQFIPSLLKFITLLSYISLGFLVVIILSFLIGRIYCSTICPIGTLQDIFSFISKRLRKKKYKPQRSQRMLQYIILIITILLLFCGTTILINMLDPYSNFGRISYNLIKPLYIFSNNRFVHLFEKFDNHYLFLITMKSSNWVSILYPLLFLSIIIWLSIKYGRLYCNSICPVGTLLGLISKYSLFQIKINSNCTSCGVCSSVCKSGCIDTINKQVDMTRCVSCLNCLGKCNKKAIQYKLNQIKIKFDKSTYSNERRNFITTSFTLFGIAGSSYVFGQTGLKTGKYQLPKTNPITPPGSQNINHFTTYCTACHLCINACPTQVLQPSLIEYGISGILLPKMDFHTNFCNNDCITCGTICPNGAIIPLTKEEKKITQIGIAKFVQKNCVVFVDEKNCGACNEHCPTKAIHLIPYKNDLIIPHVRSELCIGCGACEYACPTRPNRAIFVENNLKHRIATKPKEEKLEQPTNFSGEFPF